MGRPVLPNSPLISVACELRFAGNLALYQAWGAIQGDLRGTYPDLLVPTASSSEVPPMLQPIQLASADGRNRVMLAVNSFAVTTRAYEGYDAFVHMFQDAYGIFSRHLPVPTLARLGLRYTNALPRIFSSEQPQQAGTLHPCLKLRLTGWDGIPTRASELAQLVYNGGRGPLELRMMLAQQGAETGSAINFDLDCVEKGPVASSRVTAFVPEAHDVIDEAFFAVITDEYHEYLKGNV